MSATEFEIPRPGYMYPWVATIQFDQSQQDYAWAVFTQPRVRALIHSGHASTEQDARQAAIDSVTDQNNEH